MPTDTATLAPRAMLTPNESTVLRLRYGLGADDAATGLTLVEIARQLGVSTQRASQLETSALAKLRSALRERGVTSVDDIL
jgi:RNA polymerase sigma factor (sigma-70 family)